MTQYTVELLNNDNVTSDFHDRDDDAVRRVLSYSQVSQWFKCRHAWRLGYDLRLRTPRSSEPIDLGDCIHRYLAAWLSGQDPAPEMLSWLDEKVTKLGSTVSLSDEISFENMADTAIAIAQRTIAYLNSLGLQVAMVGDKRLVEANLRLTGLSGWDAFEAHVDAAFVDPYCNGGVLVADFKTRKSLMPVKSEDTNLQHAIYLYLLRHLGLPSNTSGTIQIISSLPATPKINSSNGQVSRTSIKTDWETYRDAILRAGEDPSQYEDMRVKLMNTRFFDIIRTYWPDQALVNIWDRVVVPAARQIAVARDSNSNPEGGVYRSLSYRDCMGCWFTSVCTGVLHGYDPEYLIRQFNFNERYFERALTMVQ